MTEKNYRNQGLIRKIMKEIKKVRLGFTPERRTGYTINQLREADTTLFVKGKGYIHFDKEQLMFPPLTHA